MQAAACGGADTITEVELRMFKDRKGRATREREQCNMRANLFVDMGLFFSTGILTYEVLWSLVLKPSLPSLHADTAWEVANTFPKRRHDLRGLLQERRQPLILTFVLPSSPR